jgi:hypothetical protein
MKYLDIVDIKPIQMEELIEVITIAKFHHRYITINLTIYLIINLSHLSTFIFTVIVTN